MRSRTIARAAAVLAAVMLTLAATVGAAAADPYAPVDRPGPSLSVPADTLAKSLTCSTDLDAASAEPVLLVPGTTLTPEVDFGWNYERAFDQQGRPWCAVTLPQNSMGDIQVAGEYVVHAIRAMHAQTGQRIEVLGHSQGGMVPRWALRFWPDTRAMVDDIIGMAPSNHGTVLAGPLCAPVVGCAPAIWQQIYQSPFIKALNSGAETFAGVSYTNIFSTGDEVVVPNLNQNGSSSLHSGDGAIANVSVQSICPVHVADHLLLGTADPVAYGLVMDALTHPGPAVPTRVDRGVCRQLVHPGVVRSTFVKNFTQLTTHVASVLALTPHVPKPPPLKPYVFD